MTKYFTIFFLFVFTLAAFAGNKKMYENNKVYPASPEFLQTIKTEFSHELGHAKAEIPYRDAMVVDESDTLTQYLERMTQPGLFGINVQNRQYPLVGTNPIYYFVGQKFYLETEQLGKYKIGGVLIPYAVNYTGGNYPDSSYIWVYPIDESGKISGSTPLAKGGILHADIHDTSMSNVLFTYTDLDSSGVINSGFLMFIQTRNFSDQETDVVALWSNYQGDGMGERRAAFLAWDNDQQHFVAADFADLQLNMPDGNPPNFDVLMLPVMVTSIPDAVDEPVTINGLTFSGLFPNPVSDVARLNFALNQSTNLSVSVINENGSQVKELANSTFAAGEHSIEFNTNDLSSGNYLIVFRSSLSSFAVKALIIK